MKEETRLTTVVPGLGTPRGSGRRDPDLSLKRGVWVRRRSWTKGSEFSGQGTRPRTDDGTSESWSESPPMCGVATGVCVTGRTFFTLRREGNTDQTHPHRSRDSSSGMETRVWDLLSFTKTETSVWWVQV